MDKHTARPAATKVLAIFVNWNGERILQEAVASLLQDAPTGLRITVVDNASTDDSLENLPEQVNIVKLPQNHGYGGAINLIVLPLLEDLSMAPDFFLILNNDIVWRRGGLSRLLECAQKGSADAIYAPQILRYDNPDRLEAAWGRVTWSHVLGHFYGQSAPADQARWNEYREVPLALGSALLIHRNVFLGTGLFDETFFMYHEEVDFIFRAQKAGYPCFYCPSSQVLHHGGYSTRRKPLKRFYWVRRNAVLFLRKHRATLSQWAYYFLTLALSLLYNVLLFRWRRVQVIFRAVLNGFSSSLEKDSRIKAGSPSSWNESSTNADSRNEPRSS